eukprot:s127_g42.t1
MLALCFADMAYCRILVPFGIVKSAGPHHGYLRWSSSKGEDRVSLEDVVAYGTWWFKTNMGQSIKEEALRSALRKQLDFLEETDEQNIAFGNVKICLEEMEHDEEIRTCILLDEGSLQDFRGNQAEDTDGGKDRQAEYETFLEFAEFNLMTSKEVLAFAEKRGARVEVVNKAAKITGYNGVQVDRITCFHSKAWNPRSGDGKRVVQKLFEMGLRKDIADSARPEYCKRCNKFQSPEEIQSCTSNHRNCRRLESDTWKMKL